MTDTAPDLDTAFAAFLAEYQAPAIAAARVASVQAEAEPEPEIGR
jgi:hypothetical protein